MKAATKTKSGDKSQNGQLITVTLNKALSAEAEWDDKDKQFHLQLKSEQKEIIQNVLERKDSMAVLPTGFRKSILDKDEFLDVIYWTRQILGLILGIVWGLIPLKGLIGLILFFAVNVGIIYFYYNSYQKIDDEDYGGPSEILKEGLMTSFSTFLVAWILLYSSLHTDL